MVESVDTSDFGSDAVRASGFKSRREHEDSNTVPETGHMGKRVNAQQIERLEAELRRLQAEGETMRREYDIASARLQGQIESIKAALAIARDEPVPGVPDAKAKMRRGAVKEHVIRLVSENAERGLVATELVELAKAQGIELERSSVSSLLSKLKEDGIFEHEKGGGYRPAKPSSPKQPPTGGVHVGGAVHAPTAL